MVAYRSARLGCRVDSQFLCELNAPWCRETGKANVNLLQQGPGIARFAASEQILDFLQLLADFLFAVRSAAGKPVGLAAHVTAESGQRQVNIMRARQLVTGKWKGFDVDVVRAPILQRCPALYIRVEIDAIILAGEIDQPHFLKLFEQRGCWQRRLGRADSIAARMEQ